MRRFSTALGALAVAATTALTFSGSALGASGQLVVERSGPPQIIDDPHGCFSTETDVPGVLVRVTNTTDTPALLFATPDCSSTPRTTLPPGAQRLIQPFETSILIK